MPCNIITLVGSKGGTLKTSSAHSLSHLFCHAGFEVVLLDLDPQASLTRRVGLERSQNPLSNTPVAIEPASGPGRIFLIPGGRAMEAAGEDDVRRHIQKAVDLDFDVLLIDTPPTFGPVVRASLTQSHLVVVPCPPGIEGLEGFGDAKAILGSVAPNTPIRAFIALAHLRSRILRWTKEEFRTAFPGALIEEVVVPFEMAAAEAGTVRAPVTVSAPHSRSAAAYRVLAQAVAQELALDLGAREEVMDV